MNLGTGRIAAAVVIAEGRSDIAGAVSEILEIISEGWCGCEINGDGSGVVVGEYDKGVEDDGWSKSAHLLLL